MDETDPSNQFRPVARAVEAVRRRDPRAPVVGLVLGSGLGGVADLVEDAVSVPYEEIPDMPRSTVKSHAGRLVLGTISGVPCVVMQGRAHFYEGHSMADTTFGVRVMQALGIHTLVVTNASGGINPAYRAGDMMIISDHIFLPGMAGHHPLRGPNDDSVGERFPAIVDAYTPSLRALARNHSAEAGLPWHEGVYVMVSGPSFETSAELHFLRVVGADAVGMSTCAEVIVARHAGTRVLGVSLVANLAFPDAPEILTHENVLVGMQAGAVHVTSLVRRIMPDLAMSAAKK